MAYSNGRIYVDTSVTPNIGVSIRDVQQCCWVRMKRTVNGQVQTKYSGDLGVLCAAKAGDIIQASDGLGNWTVDSRVPINKWARYKPERHTGIMPISYATRKANNFGLDVPFCYLDVMNAVVYDIITSQNPTEYAWGYLKPRGSSTNEFYRLTDFVRFPQERTPNANGDPTPVNLQGYNHGARFPFMTFLNMAGITEIYDSQAGHSYFQVNKQVAQELVFTFINGIGDDLHLQDFVDTTNFPDVDGFAWRPVMQLFPNTDDQGTIWYQQQTPTIEISGDAINSDPLYSLEFRVPINSLSLNTLYHICIGIGLCKADLSSQNPWYDNNSLFIVPCTDEQAENQDWPFYYPIKLVSWAGRILNVTALQYFRQGLNQWISAGGTVPYFNIDSLAAEQIRLTMTITKNGNNVAFVGENGIAPYGYGALRIQARESYTGSSGETIKYMTPNYGTNPPTGENPWATAPYLLIPAGDESDTVTIFATMYINGNIPVNGYAQYHIYVNSGATDEHGQLIWDNIGYFSIQKIPYSNS